MPGRLPLDSPPALNPPPLVLRGGPNWTAVGFLAALGILHLTIWSIALFHGHLEGYMSLILGTVFSLAAVGLYAVRAEIAVLPGERRVRLRTGFRALRIERFVHFDQVACVRITLTPEPDHAAGFVELVCAGEVIECPPTTIARQEALCLAVMMGVRLVKVSGASVQSRVE